MGIMIMRPGAAVQQVLRLSQRCRVSQEGEALDVIVCARARSFLYAAVLMLSICGTGTTPR